MALRERIGGLIVGTQELQRALARRAEEEIDTLLPAYHAPAARAAGAARPLAAGALLAAGRATRSVCATVRQRADVLPLGSGAATGNAFGLDREWLAARARLHGDLRNSLDAVGDRDFALEIGLRLRA